MGRSGNTLFYFIAFLFRALLSRRTLVGGTREVPKGFLIKIVQYHSRTNKAISISFCTDIFCDFNNGGLRKTLCAFNFLQRNCICIQYIIRMFMYIRFVLLRTFVQAYSAVLSSESNIRVAVDSLYFSNPMQIVEHAPFVKRLEQLVLSRMKNFTASCAHQRSMRMGSGMKQRGP